MASTIPVSRRVTRRRSDGRFNWKLDGTTDPILRKLSHKDLRRSVDLCGAVNRKKETRGVWHVWFANEQVRSTAHGMPILSLFVFYRHLRGVGYFGAKPPGGAIRLMIPRARVVPGAFVFCNATGSTFRCVSLFSGGESQSRSALSHKKKSEAMC